MELTHVPHDWVYQKTPVNRPMNIHLPLKKWGYFLTSWVTISFSKKAPLHGNTRLFCMYMNCSLQEMRKWGNADSFTTFSWWKLLTWLLILTMIQKSHQWSRNLVSIWNYEFPETCYLYLENSVKMCKIWGFHSSDWRMASSEMLCHVALVRTDILKELSASFIRVTRIDELGR
jgi:hypothetical protein